MSCTIYRLKIKEGTITALVEILQGNIYTIRREREREIYHEELACMILKAEKSHSLPSASRKAGGIVHSESEVLKTREINGVHFSLRIGGVQYPSSAVRQRKGEFSLPLSFDLFEPLKKIKRCPLTLGKEISFSESLDSNANIQKHPHRHSQK